MPHRLDSGGPAYAWGKWVYQQDSRAEWFLTSFMKWWTSPGSKMPSGQRGNRGKSVWIQSHQSRSVLTFPLNKGEPMQRLKWNVFKPLVCGKSNAQKKHCCKPHVCTFEIMKKKVFLTTMHGVSNLTNVLGFIQFKFILYLYNTFCKKTYIKLVCLIYIRFPVISQPIINDVCWFAYIDLVVTYILAGQVLEIEVFFSQFPGDFY